MLVGTVAYLPPEQALGRSSDAPLGPLLARRAALRAAHRRAAVPGRGRGRDHRPAPERQPGARRRGTGPRSRRRSTGVVLDLLAKSPDDRPQSAAEARRAIAPAAADADDEPRREAENPLEGLARRRVRRPRRASSAEMRGVLEDALGGHGRLVLLVRRARDRQDADRRAARDLRPRPRRARVLGPLPRGRGPAAVLAVVGGDPRLRARRRPGRACAGSSAAAAADVARIVPELAERLGDVGEPPDMETEQARFRLFDSFAGFLAGASSARAAGDRARRPALGRRAVAAAAALRRPPARRHRAAADRHLPRRRARPPPPARRDARRARRGRGHPARRTARARAEGDRRLHRADRRRRPPARRPRRGDPRADRGQPVLHRRGRAADGGRGPARRDRGPTAGRDPAGRPRGRRPPPRPALRGGQRGAADRRRLRARVPPRRPRARLRALRRTRSRRRSREAVDEPAGRASRADRAGRYAFSHALVRETL